MRILNRHPGLIVVVCAAMLLALLSFNSVRDRSGCEAHSHGLPYRYSYLWGCDYQVSGEWISDRELWFTDDGRILRSVERVSA